MLRRKRIPGPPQDVNGGPPIQRGPFDFSKFSTTTQADSGSQQNDQLQNNQNTIQNAWNFCLCSFCDAPTWLQDNKYIINGYRANLSKRAAALSVFRIHNETLNIWTHFVGFLMFVGLTVAFASSFGQVPLPALEFRGVQNMTLGFDKLDMSVLHEVLESTRERGLKLSESTHGVLEKAVSDSTHGVLRLSESTYVALRQLIPIEHTKKALQAFPLKERFLEMSALRHAVIREATEDVEVLQELLHSFYNRLKPTEIASRWPFFAFLGGAMACLLFSTFCHTFHCISRRVSVTIWRLDYAGIICLISTSFCPVVGYTFQCLPTWRTFYYSVIFTLGTACLAMTMLDRFQKPGMEAMRAGMFSALGLFGILPMGHQAFFVWNHVPPSLTQAMLYEAVMGFCYLLGAFLFAVRWPEKFFPGRFDILMHSHNIFHILVVFAAYMHYQASLLLLQWRDHQSCDMDDHLVFSWYLT